MSSDTNEAVADILREMRDRVLGEDRIKYMLPADEALAFAVRLDAAVKRELSKNGPNNGPEIGQFAPKPDWGVHEALAFANTLANHGWTRDANPDAASSCIYALCRHLRTTGNAAALRAALETILRDCKGGKGYDHTGMKDTFFDSIEEQARAALSAPARNCDVLSEEAANEAWDDYRHAHVLPRGGWDFRHIIAWIFAKAEGGDHA